MFKELIESITDGKSFVDSLVSFGKNFSVSSAVMCILVIFMIVGLVDKLRGNKHGYGEKFDEGFNAMGPLALSVVGMVSLAPVLLVILQPLLTPVFNLIGAHPAMFPGSILALDMGGYALAAELAGDNIAVANYGGIIVASTMGITICFTIPYALACVKTKDQKLLGSGILVGIITLPVGCFLGGLAMYATPNPLPFTQLLLNTLPVLILAVLLGLGLFFLQRFTMKVFSGFAKGVTVLIAVSLGLAIFQYLTGLRIPLLNKMVDEHPVLGYVPFESGLMLVGQIAIVLAGAFPLILFLNRRLGKVMNKLGGKIGINTPSSTGLLAQLASSIPVFSVINDMNAKGKLINIAFAVSGSFVLADALAFTASAAPDMVFPMLVAKLSGGILAIVLMALLLKFNKLKGVSDEDLTGETESENPASQPETECQTEVIENPAPESLPDTTVTLTPDLPDASSP